MQWLLSGEVYHDDECRSGISDLLNQLCARDLPTPSTAKSERMEEAGLVKMDRGRGTHIPTPLRSEDIYQFQKELFSLDDIDQPINSDVFQFSSCVQKFYSAIHEPKKINGEDLKVTAVLSPLQNFFDLDYCKTIESIHKPTDVEGEGKVDIICTFMDVIKFPLMVWEVKNEETSVSKSDAASQAISYYLQYVKSRKDFIVDNFPCIIVSLRGTVMSIRTVVLFDGNSCSAIETHLSTLDLSEPMAIGRLQKYFLAMKEFCIRRYASITKNLENFMLLVGNQVPPKVLNQSRYPAVCELPQLNLKFIYLNGITNKVFSAEITNDSPGKLPSRDIVVKFVKGGYCVEAHSFLAQHGFAPVLYGVRELGYDGWKMVVMEKIRGKMATAYKGKLTERHRSQEESAMKLLHDLGYVHGDFRDTNIMVTQFQNAEESKLYIIDFDWCDKNHSLCQRELNPGIQWHESAGFNKPMIRDHDLHFHNKRYMHLNAADNLFTYLQIKN